MQYSCLVDWDLQDNERKDINNIKDTVIIVEDTIPTIHITILEVMHMDIIRRNVIENTEVIDGLTDGEFVVLSVDREGVEDGAVVTPEYQ